jgi:4-alpha-glucanotransferase
MRESDTATRAGILLHLTSLPSRRLDDDCLRWLDFLSAAGMGVWQMLPLVIPDHSGSPYQSPSAFACDPNLIPIDDGPVDADEVDAFHDQHAAWLDDFVMFQVLKQRQQGKPWDTWPQALRDRDPDALATARVASADAGRRLIEQQYRIDRAWRRVRSHADALGIRLFGDIPIFIAHDSADTWSNPGNFLLDANGQPTHVTGVPPDYFAADGQRWGNPHYRWDRMQADGFGWWLDRMHRQFELFDLIRIDHFRGLVAVWMIDAACETARDGYWQETPGDALLATLAEHYPTLPIVAEDLGIITDAVRDLRRKYALPGMAVLQFAFDNFDDNPHKPWNITHDCIAYTGTHDNDTTTGWFNALQPHERDFVFDMLQQPHTDDIAGLLLTTAMQSEAWLAIAPLQDYLRLGSEARMNTPGTNTGNWSWQFNWDMLKPELAQEIRSMVEATGRCHDR